MSQPIKFFNSSFKHFSVHDVDDSCDDSNQFKDGSPYPFIDDNIKATLIPQHYNLTLFISS